MALAAREGGKVALAAILDERAALRDVDERPIIVEREREHKVARRMQRDAGDGGRMNIDDVPRRLRRLVPNAHLQSDAQ